MAHGLMAHGERYGPAGESKLCRSCRSLHHGLGMCPPLIFVCYLVHAATCMLAGGTLGLCAVRGTPLCAPLARPLANLDTVQYGTVDAPPTRPLEAPGHKRRRAGQLRRGLLGQLAFLPAAFGGWRSAVSWYSTFNVKSFRTTEGPGSQGSAEQQPPLISINVFGRRRATEGETV